ncbi:MAG: septum formation inhibitor Maf [Clostridiaceae bacterium]|nr:septum formation inhibitor Maf [Clostridiaceae bacterium]
MRRLVLESQSPRRKKLLDQIGIPFTVFPCDVDETIDEDVTPCKCVEILSTRKAEYAAREFSERLSTVVLAADTVVVLHGKILGKPKNRDEAFEMLSLLENKWHQVLTGITMIDVESGRRLVHVEKTKVKIRKLTADAIWNYIDSGEPLDKAGAYGIQGLGALLVEKLDGCYFNVVGLPLFSVSVMLSHMGIDSPLDRNQRQPEADAQKA